MTAQGTLRTGEQVQHLQADSGAVGVRLTLSRSVQRAAEAVAAQTMTTGCILVLDVPTAALRACVSVPGFDPADPAASLEAPDSPFLNRALQAYAVGSVFKPVLAAAALEAGLAPEYDCNGAVVVDGQIFRCAGGVPHGEVDLSAALAKSCNGYFIRLGQQLGAQALLQQAQALGFGRSIGLAEGLTAQSGALPGAEELAQSGQLANFSFGQGSLLATPLQVAAMMNTIANGGVYRAPCLLDCALDETSGEELSAFARPQAERVLTEQTAAALRTMLEQTVAEGTAQDASGLPGGAAGKTGTAQNPHGPDHSVFMGFAPMNNPKIAICVFVETAGFGATFGVPIGSLMMEKYLTGKVERKALEERMMQSATYQTGAAEKKAMQAADAARQAAKGRGAQNAASQKPAKFAATSNPSDAARKHVPAHPATVNQTQTKSRHDKDSTRR